MCSKPLATSGDLRAFAVILETGDEVMASFPSSAEAEYLTAAHFSAIGALSHGVISYFDWEQKEYLKILSPQLRPAFLRRVCGARVRAVQCATAFEAVQPATPPV